MKNTVTRESMMKTVASQIKASTPAVQEAVIDAMVTREVGKRTETITSGLDQLDSMQREKYKLDKPSNTTYNEDGSVASETFTKEAIEARKKHTEKMEKLERSLNKALEGDMKDLNSMVK